MGRLCCIESRNPGGTRRFLGVIREQAASLAADRATWHIPPADKLFVQRKISGTALLAARLRAHVDIRAKVAAIVEEQQ